MCFTTCYACEWYMETFMTWEEEESDCRNDLEEEVYQVIGLQCSGRYVWCLQRALWYWLQHSRKEKIELGMEISGARVLIVSYCSWKFQMWFWLDRNLLWVQMHNWAVSRMLEVGACKWVLPTQEGMQARGSKEVNSLLHGYISGFSLSSVPVLLCDTGQVI